MPNPANLEVHGSDTHKHQASNEGGCPVLLEYKIVRISSQTLIQLRECINKAVMAFDEMMLQNVWNELDYCLDICRVTQGAHIEHL